jgi:hypothetical protein
MPWLLIAYVLGLFYFAANPGRISDKGLFRAAWIWYAIIPFNHFVFTLFRAGNIRSTRGLALVEIWSDGISWLLLGISLILLVTALIPAQKPDDPASGGNTGGSR